MLVIGLLLYIGLLLILLQVNVYVALGYLFVTSILMKAMFPQLKGYIGERRIRQVLERLGEEYTVFNDLYVHKQDSNYTQIDHVLLSPYGIFVIETKNYTGWIFGQEQQKNWTQTFYKKKTRFYNPIMQNNTHIKALKHYLEIDVPIFSIIVFSDAATLKFKEPFQKAIVIQNKQLKRTIKQYTAQSISSQQLSYMAQLLQALVPTSRQQKSEIKGQHLQHVKKVAQSAKKKEVGATQKPLKKKAIGREEQKAIIGSTTVGAKNPTGEGAAVNRTDKQVQANLNEPIAATVKVCPKCSNNLVLRQGKFGAFYGCAAFPKCRYTKNLAGGID